MARTTVPEIVKERIENRLSLQLMGAENGNELQKARVESILWTLRAIGFEDTVVASVLETAISNAGLDASVGAKYNVHAASKNARQKKTKNGTENATV